MHRPSPHREAFLDIAAHSYGSVYEACAAITDLRDWVQNTLGYSAIASLLDDDQGRYWLPIILTARGPIYGEVIGGMELGTYCQPIPLADSVKQPLFHLAYELVNYLNAPPAVYLMQIKLAPDNKGELSLLAFDRLIPFPAAPAIASVGVQEPDLFVCHWRCVQGHGITDVIIQPDSAPN
ncbi:MAG: hypothetical protein WCO45_10850 [Pseudanabaena sp. ELA607]|jgi:hypothetical protein